MCYLPNVLLALKPSSLQGESRRKYRQKHGASIMNQKHGVRVDSLCAFLLLEALVALVLSRKGLP